MIGADLSEGMLALAKRRLPQLRFVQGDAVILPFEEKFDTAFSNAVFYWIPITIAFGARRATLKNESAVDFWEREISGFSFFPKK